MKPKYIKARQALILRLLRDPTATLRNIKERTGLTWWGVENYIKTADGELKKVLKAREKLYRRKYYNANKEKISIKKKEYYQKNKERLKKARIERYRKEREDTLAFYRRIGKIDRRTGKPY